MITTKEIIKSKHELKDLWATPQPLFDRLDSEFRFTLDPCCEIHNAKCQKYFTKEINGLNQSWAGERVFCNPPYSRYNINYWVKKCYQESVHAIIVALLPVSTSSDWYQDYVMNKAELIFINKRIKFVGAKYTAPFSSLIAIYGNSARIQKFEIFPPISSAIEKD